MNPSSSKDLQQIGDNLYSYVVVHDTGFAPNPFFGYCTLACCKPVIRRSAKRGDWVVGLTPKSNGNRVVYFMRIDEIADSFDDYWEDRRFTRKKPRYDKSYVMRHGDNIYEPTPDGAYRQLRSTHSDDDKDRDLRGKRVLISETFSYFGREAIELPPTLASLIVARGHKRRFSSAVKTDFIAFVSTYGLKGMHALPRKWSGGDSSCVTTCKGSC
jgi:hypothetical protein